MGRGQQWLPPGKISQILLKLNSEQPCIKQGLHRASWAQNLQMFSDQTEQDTHDEEDCPQHSRLGPDVHVQREGHAKVVSICEDLLGQTWPLLRDHADMGALISWCHLESCRHVQWELRIEPWTVKCSFSLSYAYAWSWIAGGYVFSGLCLSTLTSNSHVTAITYHTGHGNIHASIFNSPRSLPPKKYKYFGYRLFRCC